VGFHGIRLSDGVRNVFEIILLIWLAVDAEGEDAVLGKVHVCLSVVLLLDVGVQEHLEVAVLQQVGLVTI
jgi:hypothetical protein